MVVGTAALIAVAAILALAAGAALRRSAGAITAAVVLLVLPLILATVLPQAPAHWLLRLTPAAAFGLQQGNPHYAQVNSACLPYNGCYPLAPWAGFAVLCAWAAARAGRCHVPAAAQGRVMQALHAEWTKLRTVAGTGWLLLTAIVLTVGASAVTAEVVKCPASCSADPTKVSLTGVMLGQAAVAILAVLAVSSEYSTGMIRTTLTAMPRRAVALAAKAAVVTGVVLAAGTVAPSGRCWPDGSSCPATASPRRTAFCRCPSRRADAAGRSRLGPVPGPDRPAQPRPGHRPAGFRRGHRGRARPALHRAGDRRPDPEPGLGAPLPAV